MSFNMKNPSLGMATKNVTGKKSKPMVVGQMFDHDPSDKGTLGGPNNYGTAAPTKFFGAIKRLGKKFIRGKGAFGLLNPMGAIASRMGMFKRRGAAGGGGACPPGGVAPGTGAPMGGGPIGMMSDIRTKENIVRTGESKSGLPMYDFNYKGKKEKYNGVMAQDLLKLGREDAVIKDKETGLYKVNYDKIDVNMRSVN